MADEDDDAISVTSTIDRPTDGDDFFVEGIIGERVAFDDTRRWLVKWENYPLSEATWEPIEHLYDTADAMSEWETLKARIQRREAKSLVPRWVKAAQNKEWESWGRHLKRNEERERRGLEVTDWLEHPQERCLNIATQWLSEGEEVSEPSDDEPDFARLDDPTLANKPSKSNGERHKNTGNGLAGELPSHPKQPETTDYHDKGSKQGTASHTIHKGPAAHAEQSAKPMSSFQRAFGLQKPATKPPSAPRLESHPKTAGRTAIRSRPAPASVNVFAGGKIRKKRTKNEDANQGQGGKFLHLRGQNLLKKHSRDKENEAPPTLPKSLRPLNREDPAQSNKTVTPGPSSLTMRPNPIRTTSFPEDKVSEPSPNSAGSSRRSSMKPARTFEASGTASSDGNGGLERKKSVRFDGLIAGDTLSGEPSLFIDDPAREASGDRKPRMKSPPPMSQNMEATRPVSHDDLSKNCSLGAESTTPITLFFHQVPQPEAIWSESFKRQQALTFSHSCHASDFIGQFVGRFEQAGSGVVSSPGHHEILETVSDRLKLGSLGIFCRNEDYCVILYPSKSEEWAEADQRRVESKDTPMKYIILASACFQQSELPQNSPTDRNEPFVGHNLTSFLNLEAGKKVYQSVGLTKTERHHVFLAFPPSALIQARLMTQWLKVACKLECAFLGIDNTVGDWERFKECEKGALIIHEDALRKIRLFPGMFEVLKRSSQGRIAVSILDRALASSISTTMWSMKTPMIGNLGLRRLASTGAVFLMAPSFILTSPKACCRFLKWVWKHHTSEKMTLRVKLAVPADIVEWIEDLAINKIQRRECTCDDEEYWRMCIHILVDLRREMPADDVTESFDILSPLALAPDKIDASDEQSLVNWFGWWTTSVLDKYCSFYILGSGPFSGSAATVHLKPVRWEKNLVNNADYSDDRLQQDVNIMPVPSGATNTSQALQLINSDSGALLHDYLRAESQRQKKTYNHMYLYFKPVGYEDSAMAFRSGDSGAYFETYQQWFTSFLPISDLSAKYKIGSPVLKHTLTGLFYTFDPESQDGGPADGRREPDRHSWLAMFRPCNPEQAPWGQTELLIWDQRYRGTIKGGQDLYESDLLEVHRIFIDHIGRSNNTRNYQNPLSKVWLGGWGDWRSPHSHPLDITLDRFNLFADNLKQWVPYWGTDLPAAGWTLIKPDKWRPEPMHIDKLPPTVSAAGVTATKDNMDENANLEAGDDEWDPKARMIFHAPRKHNPKTNKACTNHFYKITQTPFGFRDGRFTYKYVPTKKWYRPQAEQGRGFEHIMVEPWRDVFEELKIPTD